MKLVAHESIHGVEAGQTFEVGGAEACRLVTYGYASPAKPGAADPVRFGVPPKRRQNGDAALAADLRTRRAGRGERESRVEADCLRGSGQRGSADRSPLEEVE